MPYTPHPWDTWRPPLKDTRARPAGWVPPAESWRGLLYWVASLAVIVPAAGAVWWLVAYLPYLLAGGR
jgi:hypothetical protein